MSARGSERQLWSEVLWHPDTSGQAQCWSVLLSRKGHLWLSVTCSCHRLALGSIS